MSSAIKSVLSGSVDDLDEIADQEIDFSRSEIDYYAVRVYRDGVQGARSVEGFEELESPIPKESFEEVAQAEGLERGTYKLYAIGGEQRRLLGAVWTVEAGVIPPEEEADLETRLARLERLAEQPAASNIDGPGDAFAVIVERLLEEDELIVEFDLDKLSAFLTEWLRREDPPTPDMYAGQIIEQLAAEGEHEAALQMLDIWFQYDSRGDAEKSLVELATEFDDFDFTVSNASTLGALKLLDNPQEIGRAVGEAVGAANQLSDSIKEDQSDPAAIHEEQPTPGIDSDSNGEPNEKAQVSED